MSRGASTTREDEPSTAKKAIRTVTPEYFGRPDTEMTIIGIVYFLGLVILLVPLLPFIVIIWAIGKVMDRYQRDTGRE